MSQLVRLDSERHRQVRIAADAAVSFASQQHMLLLRAAEAGKAVSSFPVFCSRHPATGEWALSAVTGLKQGSNLFVDDGVWTASYEPTAMQTYPLFLMQSPDDQAGYTVGIDEGSAAIAAGNGEALFDASGKPSLYLERMTTLLKADIDNDIQTRRFLEKLDAEGLFKAIHIVVFYEDGESQTITGLHTIDEERLQALPSDRLMELHSQGYLLIAHAMLLSIHQLNALIRRSNQRGGSGRIKQINLQLARDAASAGAGQ